MTHLFKKSDWGSFGFTWRGIQAIFRKELIQLIRDPYLVMFIIALPVIQLLVTGLAVERDLKHIPLVVVNRDQRSASRQLLQDFENSTLFELRPVASDDQAMRGIRQGKYRAGIFIPPDYSERILNPNNPPQINLIVDGTQSAIAKTILEGAHQVVLAYERSVGTSGNSGDFSTLNEGIHLNTKVLYNPSMSSAYFLVPGILALVMHMLTILFTSFAVVRESEAGTLEQLMVSPVRVTDLMLGKVLPYAFIGFLDMLLTLGVMVWFFHIGINGNFAFLCLASFIFILCSLGVGLLISILCKTQVQAIQLTVAIFLPSLMLSGFVFPLEPMPWFIKIVSYCLPLTYYLEIIRSVVLKGIGPADLWHQTCIIFLMAVLMLGSSVLRFNKQLN